MSKIIGVVGSRRRHLIVVKTKLKSVLLTHYKDGDKLCSGGCPKGADRFAEEIAKERGWSIIIHYPNWDRYGRGAGFVRNTYIAQDSDMLIACVAKDRKGGTEDTIKKFVNKTGMAIADLISSEYLILL